jgi:hypothetical protein
VSRIKEYYHDEICEGLGKISNDREGIAPRRGTSTHLSVRKEMSATRQINGEPAIVSTSKDETQTDLGGTLPNDGRVRGH